MRRILQLITLFSVILTLKVFAGDGSEANPYTVAEARALAKGSDKIWVQGYIVGGRYDDFDQPWDNDYGVSIADNTSETTIDNCIQIKLESSTGHRATYGLNSNPGVYGTQIKAYGFRDDYGGASFPSIEGITSADFIVVVTSGNGGVIETVNTPTFNPAAGTYTTTQNITISSSTSGTSIYYTTDGSTPNEGSTPYAGPVTISETTTLSAIAYKDGKASNVSTAIYTLEVSSTDTSIPYEQNFTTDAGNFTIASDIGSQMWHWGSFDGGCMTMSGYESGNFENTDWLISPTFDFSSYTDLEFTFREAINYITSYNDLQVMISSDYSGDATTATWTELTVTGRSTGDNWNFVDIDPIDLSEYEGEATVTVGFKFTSSSTASSTWEISKVNITGTEAAIVEPSNHVTNFSATGGTITTTSIELAWNENDGTAIPDGYLIKASTEEVLSPIDSIDINDDIDLTDGTGNVKVLHGTTSYTFEDCSPGTTYNFSIYPFAGSGDSIRYKKVDAPSTQATTISLPTEAPSNFEASVASTTQINLSWQRNSVQQQVVLVTEPYNEIEGNPVNGINYSFNDILPGGGTVIYVGSEESFNHIGLEESSYYYYKIWSVSATGEYSEGIGAYAATLSPEPGNHVENFKIDSIGLNTIALSWTNNQGDKPADGYILTINDIAINFATPIDGTQISGDTDISDGTGAVVVSSDVESFTWEGLNTNTTYILSIYPYTNSGEFIDYKTDNAPTITGSTIAGVSSPEFSPISGSYTDSIEVTISCKTIGASIYYSLDGSTPDNESILYTVPFKIYNTTSVNAIALLDTESSSVTSANYSITESPIIVNQPIITPVAGEYFDSVLVEINCDTEGATIYYTLNGDTPDSNSALYNSAFTLYQTSTIKAIAIVETVVSEITEVVYTVSPTPIDVATPLILPENVEYSDSVVISIECETDDAIIYYSTDGSIPTKQSTLYTGSFTIFENSTITAIAYVNEFSSETTSKTYVVVETVVPVEVNTIEELRAGETDGTVYHYNAIATVTFAMSFRNQKFIQDGTAAILIDDSKQTITESYQIGDGITDLLGTLTDYNGLLEFVPTSNAAKTATAFMPNAQTIEANEFNSNFEEYESELVRFEKIDFEAVTFANGTDYELTQNGEALILRTHFYDVDYIGSTYENKSVNITGIALWHSNQAKVVPRNSSDIEIRTSVDQVNSNIKVYGFNKNVIIDGMVSNSNITIYSIDGRTILQKEGNGSTREIIPMSKQGIYLVHISGKTESTHKVIIK